MARAQDIREEQSRRTLKDTERKQNRLLRWIQLLIKEKGKIPPQQRETFITSLYDTTLLEGRGISVVYKSNNGNKINFGKFFDFAQAMAFQTSSIVKITYKTQQYQIPIEELWRTLHKYLLKIFPTSAYTAFHMSSEFLNWKAPSGSVEYKPQRRSYRSE